MKNTSTARKQNKPIPKGCHIESFTITTEPLTSDDRKESRQEFTAADAHLLACLMKTLRTNPKTITSEKCAYFREVEKLRAKYPLNPTPLNYLANGYQCLNQMDKAKNILFETCEKFPNYLFARTAKANLLFNEGKIAEGFAAMGHAMTIKQLYPHRDVFHVSEVRAFEEILVKYFYLIQNMEQATQHLKILEKIALELLEDPQDSAFLSAESCVRSAKLQARVKKVR